MVYGCVLTKTNRPTSHGWRAPASHWLASAMAAARGNVDVREVMMLFEERSEAVGRPVFMLINPVLQFRS